MCRNTLTRGKVEVATLRTADAAYAEVAPALGNNCFVFRDQEPILEPMAVAHHPRRPAQA